MADLNFIALTGVATKDATVRPKASGQIKAEFSFEVDRPFYRATGEPVSDLFLVDVWEDLGRWAVENIKEGTRLLVIGTLNKESYSTRGGREHLTIVKAKYIQTVQGPVMDEQVDPEELKRDCWSSGMLLTALNLVQEALRTGSASAAGESSVSAAAAN